MRKIDYEKFVNEKKKRAGQIWKLRGGRLPRRRPRKKDDMDALIKLDILRMKAWLKSGKLEVLGPRKYRLNVQ